jgi:hypothetical protein
MGGNTYGNDFRSIESHSIFDRYTGIYDHIGLIPESPMFITRTREYFNAGGPKKYDEIWSESSDSRNALRSTNSVPYELGEC